MTIARITLELEAMVDLIHQSALQRKAGTYQLCEAGFKDARKLNDDAAFIAIALDYADVIDLQGYPEYCIDILYEALQLSKNYHLFHAEGRLLIAIGRSVYTRADYSRAMQAWARALEVATLGKDDLVWVWAKVGIAQIHSALDDNTTAISLLTQAKERANAINNSTLLMEIIVNLGASLFHTNKFDLALKEYNKGLAIAEELNIQDTIGETLFRIAEVHVALNHVELGIKFLGQAETICKKTHHIWALANIRGIRAKIFDKQSNYESACIELTQGIKEAKESSSMDVLMRLYFSLSEIAENNLDYQLSLSAYKSAIDLQKIIFPRNNQQQLEGLQDLTALKLSPSRLLLNLSNNTTLNQLPIADLAITFCQSALSILNIPQASFWAFENTNKELSLLSRCSESVQQHCDETISVTYYSEFFSELLHGDTIVAHTVKHHQKIWPLYNDHFKNHGISSAIITPVRINSELHGMLCFEHCKQQHNWSQEEIQYANQLANIMMREISNIEIRNFDIEIKALNTQLLASNNELEQRVEARTNELSSTTAHLIQTEKMAALGQLIAGVAHEINTPISAVKSSGTNIADALQHMLSNFPRVLNILNKDCQTLFIKLLGHLALPHDVLNSREERRITRQLSSRLEAENIPEAHHKAYILVQLNAWTAIDDYWMLLHHPQCELILDTGYSIATITSNTANINTAVDRVAKIIFALKSFARFSPSDEVVEANLRDGLETVLTVYNSQIKEQVELIQHYDDIPSLVCYPDELNQVWTNLIHNALQAMPQKGKLFVHLRCENNEAIVAISDSGCGIPAKIQEKIFMPFFTTKAIGEGCGLGLDIVKKIVDKHGGRINVTSTVGVGTTFTIYLPYGMKCI